VSVKESSIGILAGALGIIVSMTPEVACVVLLDSEWKMVYFFFSDIEVISE